MISVIACLGLSFFMSLMSICYLRSIDFYLTYSDMKKMPIKTSKLVSNNKNKKLRSNYVFTFVGKLITAILLVSVVVVRITVYYTVMNVGWQIFVSYLLSGLEAVNTIVYAVIKESCEKKSKKWLLECNEQSDKQHVD